jgi:hypothetical protein
VRCRFYALKQGDRIFYPGGPAGMTRLSWSSDPELFKRWSTGTTGMPLVDANMRELVQTGRGSRVLWTIGLRAVEQVRSYRPW